jgi:hypothetical protein
MIIEEIDNDIFCANYYWVGNFNIDYINHKNV